MNRLKLKIKPKVTLVFAFMAVLLSFTIGYAAYSLNTRQVERQYETLAMSSAKMAAGLIHGGSIDRYLQNGKDAEYEEVYAALLQLKTFYELEYLYVLVPDLTTNDATYVFDIFKEGDNPDMVMDLGDMTGWLDVYNIVYELYTSGHTAHPTIITNSEFGYLSSAYVPIYAPDGRITAVVGVDISMKTIIDEVWSHTVQILSAAILIILLFLWILLLVVDRQILRPIAWLSRHMESFTASGDELKEILALRSGDELESMSNSFNQMVDDLRLYIQNLSAVTADRERIAAELDVARHIQNGMLPSLFPAFPERPEFDIFASMTPAKEVGGDFYDFFILPDDRLCLVAADVSGKGVPAALFMVITKTLIKNQAIVSSQPGDILTAVNRQLCEANEADFFVTAFIGIAELKTGKFLYANAGHCVPFINRGQAGYGRLDVDSGFVLAGLPDFVFETAETNWESGDSLFLYTDGVTEAQNAAEELWGEDRLCESLNEGGALKPSALIPHVMNRLERFVDGAGQSDDITMLAILFR